MVHACSGGFASHRQNGQVLGFRRYEPECSGYRPAACREITDIPITSLFAALGFGVARLDGENWIGRVGAYGTECDENRRIA